MKYIILNILMILSCGYVTGQNLVLAAGGSVDIDLELADIDSVNGYSRAMLSATSAGGSGDMTFTLKASAGGGAIPSGYSIKSKFYMTRDFNLIDDAVWVEMADAEFAIGTFSDPFYTGSPDVLSDENDMFVNHFQKHFSTSDILKPSNLANGVEISFSKLDFAIDNDWWDGTAFAGKTSTNGIEVGNHYIPDSTDYWDGTTYQSEAVAVKWEMYLTNGANSTDTVSVVYERAVDQIRFGFSISHLSVQSVTSQFHEQRINMNMMLDHLKVDGFQGFYNFNIEQGGTVFIPTIYEDPTNNVHAKWYDDYAASKSYHRNHTRLPFAQLSIDQPHTYSANAGNGLDTYTESMNINGVLNFRAFAANISFEGDYQDDSDYPNYTQIDLESTFSDSIKLVPFSVIRNNGSSVTNFEYKLDNGAWQSVTPVTKTFTGLSAQTEVKYSLPIPEFEINRQERRVIYVRALFTGPQGTFTLESMYELETNYLY